MNIYLCLYCTIIFLRQVDNLSLFNIEFIFIGILTANWPNYLIVTVGYIQTIYTVTIQFRQQSIFHFKTEAEFLDVIVTKILTVFIPSPTPLSKSGLKLVCNVNIVYENLKSENSPD